MAANGYKYKWKNIYLSKRSIFEQTNKIRFESKWQKREMVNMLTASVCIDSIKKNQCQYVKLFDLMMEQFFFCKINL